MNKYLEKLASALKVSDKQASWKDPSKFLGYVTGARKGLANAKVRHMEEAIANKLSIEDLKNYASKETKETTKARFVAAGSSAAIGGGAVYGYKKIKDKQDQETIARYNQFLKNASIGAAGKELGGSALSGVGRILHHVGKTTVDVMNTAGGGKIKNYAINHGMKHGGKEYKQFINSDVRSQTKTMLGRKPDASAKQVEDEVKNLHKSRRDARIALTSTSIAGISGYGWHKNRQALKKTEQGFY